MKSKNKKMCIFIVLIFVLVFVGIGITNVRSQPTMIGVIAQYNIPLAIFFINPVVIFFICLNYRWKQEKQDLREITIVIGSAVLLLFVITLWNLSQFSLVM